MKEENIKRPKLRRNTTGHKTKATGTTENTTRDSGRVGHYGNIKG